jgi:lysine-specific demethylase 8
MDERMMSLRHFVINHLGPSCCRPVWALDDSKSSTAYLAQHHLLDQIPELLKDVGEAPTSVDSPAHINVWIGSGGTRTPLHYDSFGNMFVQLVGVKYVRIYRRDETPKLYISKASSYAAQGNMSEINCEMEDFEKHPLAENALYTETVLFPGDCLFIPCGVWHYVRALSTSVSVNYWWSQ